jgi:hypothetical protein
VPFCLFDNHHNKENNHQLFTMAPSGQEYRNDTIEKLLRRLLNNYNQTDKAALRFDSCVFRNDCRQSRPWPLPHAKIAIVRAQI